MMRHVVFALVLVGAAFAGGAAINGPGLAWLQRTLVGGPTIIVDATSAPFPTTKQPTHQFPAAPTPPLDVDLARDAPPSKKLDVVGPDADLPLLPDSPVPPAPTPTPTQPAGPSPTGPPPAPWLTKPSAAKPAPTASPAPAPTPDAEFPIPPDPVTPPPKADPVARLASVSNSGPEPAVEAPSTTTPATPARDWGDLRRRMKALGIARYAIEAETEGRVRFSCVIPVDGLRAVGHHFEAEGDDEYQAAEAALRRVALWRATSPN